MTIVWAILLSFGLAGPIYAVVMGIVVRRGAPERPDMLDRMHVICIVPCLNEGRVVEGTVTRLLALDDAIKVVIVDDASDDETPIVLARIPDDRVVVLRRDFPDAQKGKGAALNHAMKFVSAAAAAEGVDPDRVVVAVFDGDGRVDPNALDMILPWFTEPDVGGVQIAVRIDNRDGSLLARMQDVEFAAFAKIFQEARNRITSTGLGGNGQFTRLSAMQELGEEPWEDTLTEDLDLGIRLRLAGWRSVFEGSVAVHQQGLHNAKALLRQRTRWFQGHIQAWHLLPAIWRSNLRVSTKADMSSHLLLPVMLLLVSIGVIASSLATGIALWRDPGDTASAMAEGPFIPWWYLLGFMATPLIAAAYWRTERSVGLVHGILLAHLYSLFTWVWFLAGWRAAVRQFRGDAGWAKTDRLPAAGPVMSLPAPREMVTAYADQSHLAAGTIESPSRDFEVSEAHG